MPYLNLMKYQEKMVHSDDCRKELGEYYTTSRVSIA
jgi:hypothetical protein